MTATGAGLGVLWAALVVAAVTGRRRPPARVWALGLAVPAPVERARPDPRLVVGRVVLRGRVTTDDRTRRVGGTVLAAAAAFVLVPTWPPLAPALAAAAAWWWPVRVARAAARRRAGELAAAVPDVVDLFLLAVDAGLTVPLAVRAVARRARDGPLADELRRTVGELDLGRRTADALDDLAAASRAGDAVRPLTTVLAASERYGAPLADSLARLAHDTRSARRRRAEETARRLPVTLLFPLVLCTLPAFGLLTVGPLVAGALRSLRL